MTYLTNRLNDYETYTYNLQMYMVHPSQLSQLDGSINNGQGILIADNVRIAKYNLTNIEQIYSVGHNIVRETFGNKFQITLSEPNGVTLLSTLYASAKQLNIYSHLHAGYIIAINFHGRMSDGRARKFDQTFYYPVVIRHLEFKVTEGGTVYTIEAVENSSNGYRYLNNVIREQVTVVAETVGEFAEEFEKRFNQSILNAWMANPNAGAIPDSYKFEFDESTEDWRNWRFQILDAPEKSDGANFEGVPGPGGLKLQVTVNNGSNITAIFGQVLQLTAEYKNILASQGNRSSGQYFRQEPSESTSMTLDMFPTFFKIISNVEYGKFDILRGEYQKKIIYKLKAYIVPDELLDSNAYRSSITNSGVQARRVKNLVAGNFLRKKYDYFYTGNNTEVMEFDMQFDLAYFYVTPYGDGYFGDPNVQSPNFAKDKPEIISRLDDVKDARQRLATASQDSREISALGTSIGSSVTEALRRAEIAAVKALDTTVNETLDFFEQSYEWTPQDINYQLRFVQDVISDQDTSTSDNDTQSGGLKMGAVKANLDNTADLIKIELVIRGDPYWMGVPNSLYNAQQDVDSIANFEAGSQFFFLNVNLPSSEEDFSGRRKPKPDYQMSGVYRVVNVINRFQNGQFIQYLSAVRDLATNTSTIYEFLAGDNSIIREQNSAQTQTFAADVAQRLEDAERGIIRGF